MILGLNYIHAKSTCKVRNSLLRWMSLKSHQFCLIHRKYECLYELRKRMLLTITTTYQPATDLGYLLHKNPARVQSFSLSFGQAHVFYPEASSERCTAALLLDIDPVHLVRGRRSSVTMEQYVNDRPYFTVTLEANCRLSDLLTHLYVLVPVLDDDKHYWIGDDEVEKLLRHGKGWLETHPEREQIASRYLKHKRDLTQDAIARLTAEDSLDQDAVQASAEEEAVEERINLHQQRLGAVIAVLHSSGAKRVLDLGCGEGRLLKMLLQDKAFEQIVGLDVSYRALEIARGRLHIERLPPRQKERITLIHGTLTYRDRRLGGYDAAAVVEVIEHLDPSRLAAFERVLFEFAKPGTVVVTTPNAEYNVKFETLPAGKFRHKDHRFEWTRAEFQAWAAGVAERFGYTVRFLPIGPEDPVLGAPTQMGVFSRIEGQSQ